MILNNNSKDIQIKEIANVVDIKINENNEYINKDNNILINSKLNVNNTEIKNKEEEITTNNIFDHKKKKKIKKSKKSDWFCCGQNSVDRD